MVDLCATILPAAMPCVVVRGANRCQKLKEWLFSERYNDRGWKEKSYRNYKGLGENLGMG